jgi:hypothetical protein
VIRQTRDANGTYSYYRTHTVLGITVTVCSTRRSTTKRDGSLDPFGRVVRKIFHRVDPTDAADDPYGIAAQ